MLRIPISLRQLQEVLFSPRVDAHYKYYVLPAQYNQIPTLVYPCLLLNFVPRNHLNLSLLFSGPCCDYRLPFSLLFFLGTKIRNFSTYVSDQEFFSYF